MRRFWAGLSVLVWAAAAWAGGGPQNVLVIVNDNSPASEELGQYYQDARGIPERNLFHISTTTNYTIDTAAFSNEIRNPVFAYIGAAGLSNQVDYLVFSRDIPYRVGQGSSTSSLTSSMFYGFKTNMPCDFPYSATRNDYYENEKSFSHSGSPSSNRYYLATLLVSTNSDSAKRVVDRSVAADFTQPTGTVYLFHTPDARNLQWPLFEEADFASRFVAPSLARVLEDGYFISGGRSNVFGLMIGQCCSIPTDANQFVPGALADHLTSYAGVLYEPSGQQSILNWLSAGCAGSYGTILEPCTVTQKFSDVRVHYWYARGFNMAESYYMSVKNPYEGVLVGDPLCAPFAQPPSVTLSGIASNQSVAGTVAIAVTGTAVSAQARIDRIDILLDDILLNTLTNAAPDASNQVFITVNGSTYTKPVVPGQDIYQVATGLAALVNADTGVTARALGDRIELKQRALGVAGTGITYSAGSTIGVGTELTVSARSAGTNFAETTEAAIEGAALSGVAVPGDILRAVVTRLDAVVVTNQVVALTNGTTAMQLLTNLYDAVNADPNLQGATGCRMGYLWNPVIFGFPDPPEAYFIARTNTWQGENLFLTYSVITNAGSTLATNSGFSDNFNDNITTLSARGEVFISAGRNPLGAAYQLATTNLSDGPHTLTAVVYDGGGLKTQGRVSVPFVVDNNSLTCTVVRPLTGNNFLRGSSFTADVSTVGTITQVSLYVESKLYAQSNAPPYTFVIATTNLGAGAVGVQARADAVGQSVLSDTAVVTLYTDDDGDGVSDQWEYQHFGSAAIYGATNDPDGDRVDNRDEWFADSQPTNGANFFHSTSVTKSTNGVSVSFVASTARQYEVDVNDVSLTNGAAWTAATNFSRGQNGETTWQDDSGTSSTRFYRIDVNIP